MDPRDAFLERAKAGGGGIVPVIREIVTDADTPVAAFAKIARPPFAFLLESLVGGERWARYTFLGTEPREVWRYPGRALPPSTQGAGGRGGPPDAETDRITPGTTEKKRYPSDSNKGADVAVKNASSDR